MKTLVLYHADCIDGFGAAFAAYMQLSNTAEYVPIQYGYTTLPEFKGCDVYLLDFSLKREDMGRLFSDANRVVWLDHHVTAFQMFDPHGYAAMGDIYQLSMNGEIRLDESWGHIQTPCTCKDGDRIKIRLDNRKSGAMLAWEYFNGPRLSIPTLFRYIDDYDRWQFLLPECKSFQHALRSLPMDFLVWHSLHYQIRFSDANSYRDDKDLAEFIGQGKAILRVHQQNVEKTISGNALRCAITVRTSGVPTVTTYRGWAANCPRNLASDVGYELARSSSTYGLCWYVDCDGDVKCSLRSGGDFDVAKLAQELGGGGHKTAAGFRTTIERLREWGVV